MNGEDSAGMGPCRAALIKHGCPCCARFRMGPLRLTHPTGAVTRHPSPVSDRRMGKAKRAHADGGVRE
jgi:hypothetical protein